MKKTKQNYRFSDPKSAMIFPLVHIFLSKSGILNCANGQFNATFQGSTNGKKEQSSPKMKVIIKFLDTDVIIQSLSL